MPAVIEVPLAVLFTLPGGVIYRRRMDDLPNQSLAADLAAGLAAATHPHGPIRTRSVAMQYVQTTRRMVRELHAAGFAGGLGQLSTAMIIEYWLSCDFHRERRIRAVLAAYVATGGALDAASAGTYREGGSTRSSRADPTRPTPTASGDGSPRPAPRSSGQQDAIKPARCRPLSVARIRSSTAPPPTTWPG